MININSSLNAVFSVFGFVFFGFISLSVTK